MLQTFSVPPGGRQINAKASFFRYESVQSNGADESIRVRAGGSDLGTYLPGDYIELPTDESTWQITPTSPSITCIVRLGLGRVGSNRVAGVTDVQNKVSANVVLLSFGLGSVFGFAATQALDPLLNVRGARIRNVYATASGGTGNAQTLLIAAPSVPASANPAVAIWLANAFTPNTTSAVYGQFDVNVTIAPGLGIWACTNHGGASGAVAGAQVAYELL